MGSVLGFMELVKRFEMFMKSKRILVFITFVFLFGIIGLFYMKPFIEFAFLEMSPWNHSVWKDNLYTRRLPKFIIIGVKKCATSESFPASILHKTFFWYWSIDYLKHVSTTMSNSRAIEFPHTKLNFDKCMSFPILVLKFCEFV